MVSAWQTAQESLIDLESRLSGALMALVDGNQGQDVDELEQFWGEFTSDSTAIFPALDAAINAITAGLTAYGRILDEFYDDLKNAILAAAVEAGFEELVVIVADLATEGAAVVLTGPEGELIAARAASHLGPVINRLVQALITSNEITNVEQDGHTALAAAIQAMPQPDLATHEAWQTGDDVHPANNPTPRGAFNPDETRIASAVQSDGHVVMPIYEDHSKNDKNADAMVDGQPVEFKTLEPTSGASTIKNRLNKSQRGGGQAPEVVIDARGTQPPITPDAATTQLRRFFAGSPPISNGTIQRVTVLLADGTKATWPPDYEGL